MNCNHLFQRLVIVTVLSVTNRIIILGSKVYMEYSDHSLLIE